jgi:hypothetical protein
MKRRRYFESTILLLLREIIFHIRKIYTHLYEFLYVNLTRMINGSVVVDGVVVEAEELVGRVLYTSLAHRHADFSSPRCACG